MMMLIIFLLGIVDISDVQMCWCSWYLMVSAPRVLRQASSSDFERIFLQLRWLKSRQEKEDDDGDDDCDANDYCIKDDNGVGNNDANGDDNDIYNAGDENPNSVECGEKMFTCLHLVTGVQGLLTVPWGKTIEEIYIRNDERNHVFI